MHHHRKWITIWLIRYLELDTNNAYASENQETYSKDAKNSESSLTEVKKSNESILFDTKTSKDLIDNESHSSQITNSSSSKSKEVKRTQVARKEPLSLSDNDIVSKASDDAGVTDSNNKGVSNSESGALRLMKVAQDDSESILSPFRQNILSFDLLSSDVKSLGLKPRILPKVNDVECYDYSKGPSQLFLLAYGAPDFARPSMSSIPEDVGYLDERKTSQSQQIGYRGGLQVKYLFDNGFYLKGGVEYGNIRERFKYRKVTETDTILDNQVIEINIDLNGDTTLILGPAPVKIVQMKNWSIGNSYKSFGANIMAGYQVEQGQFFYGFETGLMYNLWYDFKGMVLNDQLDPIRTTDYFVNRSKFSLLAGLNAGYHLTGRHAIFASLDYRGNLNPINTSKNLVTQRNHVFGLAFGIQLKL